LPATNEYVNVLLASGSVVEKYPTSTFPPKFSLMLLLLNEIDAGVSLTLVILTVNVVSKNCPSELVERTLIEYDDFA